jgi:ribonuclease HI
MNEPHVWLFTDGSSRLYNDIGAWAGILITPTTKKIIYGTAFPTTISRCELIPVIEGLLWVKKTIGKNKNNLRVRIVSDSEYVVRTLGGEFEAQKNQDLWAGYEKAAEPFNISAVWRERNSHPYMSLADATCWAVRQHVAGVHEGILATEIPDVSLEGI